MAGNGSSLGVTKTTDTKGDPNPKNKIGASPEEQRDSSGVGNTPKAEQQVILKENPNTEVLQQGNATIEYGASGSIPGTHMMRLAVGHGQPLINLAPIDPKTGEQQRFVNEPRNAASAIILTTKENTPEKAKVAAGSVPAPDEEQANIYITSDRITLDGTQGIRMVTKRKKINAKGGNIGTVQGIELIAGNDDSDLQPMVKGDNLINALKDLSETLEAIVGTIHAMAQAQNKMNKEVKGHQHPDLFTMFCGTTVSGNPKSFSNGECQKSKKVYTMGSKTCSMITEYTLPDCEKLKRALGKWRKKYLDAGSGDTKPHTITSQHNKVN